METGIWPLKEYRDGRIVHTKAPKKRLSVERYLEKQGRFAHLFRPQRQQQVIDQIQAKVDAYWRDATKT